MRLDDSELESILDQGESFRVDYKERLDGNAPTSIREAVCSFANDLPGLGQPGVVFVGVNGGHRGPSKGHTFPRRLRGMDAPSSP